MTKVFNHIIAIIIWIVITIMLISKSESLMGVFFFIPFVLGPHIISHVMMFLKKNLISQLLLMAAQLAYFFWFCFVYNDIFYKNVDPQSAIGLVFVGVYASPFLSIFWVAAGVIINRNDTDA